MRNFSFLLCLLCLAGCTGFGSSNFEIKVTGDAPFSGAIMVVRDCKSEQRSVDGQAPTSYQEQGTMVSVSFQKKQASGTLGVEILKNGQPAASQTTTADYGVVTAATQ